ncbi:hypothetical protein [Providencia stuartii]|nr:hypothetical protein [Providencia stuartii]MDF4176452.1 hypothetical protein [Providencia thailandensis]WIJ74895.1 hypothetical protein OI982_05230 [Providencia thailandensis]CAK6614427.1 hypothetical protein PSTU1396_14285 [Providencia stuartii]CAK6615674.1 hypothetical protein PS9952019_14285 [Providencia stuartii]
MVIIRIGGGEALCVNAIVRRSMLMALKNEEARRLEDLLADEASF